MRWLVVIPALFLGAGVGLLFHRVLRDVVGALAGRTRRWLTTLRQEEKTDEPSEEEIYGLPRNLAPLMMLCAAGGLALTMTMMTGPTRVAGVLAVAIPLVWKRRALALARHRARRELAEILEILFLSLTFGGSFAGTLMDVADAAGKGGGVVRRRILANRQVLILQGPEAFLERLGQELRLGEIRGLLRRIRAARLGGLSYEDAVRSAVLDVRQEIWYSAEMDVEGAPVRLLIPMVFTLLPTALVMLLYPPATALQAMLAGAGPEMFPNPR